MSRARDLADGTFSGAFSADSPTLVVDDANNRVGVGTATPTEPLDVSGNIRALGANSRMMFGPDGYEASIKYATDASFQIASRTGEVITFTNGTDGTERLRILPNGGITFNGDTAAANALDDYEEGTWSPQYTTSGNAFSSVTYRTDVTGGRYTKIGSAVLLSGVIYTNAITLGSASGGVRIGNLPFAVASNSSGQNGYIPIYIGESANFTGQVPTAGRTVPGTSVIDLFYRTAADVGTSTLLTSDMGTSSNDNLIRFACFYTTAS